MLCNNSYKVLGLLYWMRAAMSSYLQGSVDLTERDIKELERHRGVDGLICVYGKDGGREFPLRLRVTKDVERARWWAKGLPVKSFFEERERYLIVMPWKYFEVVKEGRKVAVGGPTRDVDLRQIWIGLEDVI